MTRNQTLARVDSWRLYCLARGTEAANAGDIPAAMTWRSDAARAREDLAWLKRGTNWRAFEREAYAWGTRTPWGFIYPAHIASTRVV